MGAYIYSVRTKSVTATIEGQFEQIFSLAYLVKPWGYSCPLTNRLTGAAEATWDRREAKGLGRAKFVYLTSNDKGKPSDGCPVYEWDGRAHDWDEPRFEGAKRTVGYLHKVGRVWVVEPVIYSVSVGTMKGSCLHLRLSGKVFFERGKALAFAKANVEVGETVTISMDRAAPKSALERVAEPATEVSSTVAERLLHGPWPCHLGTKAEQDAADDLVVEGRANIVRGCTYTSYDLTNHGLYKLANVNPEPKVGRYVTIRLTTDEVVFSGGKFGDHSIVRLTSDLARVKAHWEGYCEAQRESA